MSEIGGLVVEGLRGRGIGPIDLSVPRGRAAAVLGPSGAGKSLFLRRVADLDPGDGRVRVGPLRHDAVPASEWRRRVAYLPAEPGWWAPDVVAHFPEGVAADQVARLGLPPDVASRMVANLSTGERQRLALLRALHRRPEALLLDEPTSALDPASVEAVVALLRERLAAGLILIIVTHDRAVAERLGATCRTMAAGLLGPAEPA